MDPFRQQRSPGPSNFLGLFSNPPPRDGGAAAAAHSPNSGADELDEDDILWTETDSSEPMPSPNPNPNPNPNPSRSLFRPVHRRFPDRNFGILAALPDEDKKRARPLLQRKTFSPSSSSAAISPSSPSSSARMIPIPIPKAEYSISIPGGKIYRQSAPVNVPVAPVRVRARRVWEEPNGEARGDEDVEEEEMLPPHEIVARAASKESPLTAFSMLEGVGRTLKGRDLRRVRNAVWRQTGFLD